MKYEGKLYGKVGGKYIQLAMESREVDRLIEREKKCTTIDQAEKEPMKEILKAIEKMTVLADTTNVPGHMHGRRLDEIREIGQTILAARKTVDYDRLCGDEETK